MLFTEENVRKLFGHEAAEDDDEINLCNFYVKGAAYETLKSSLPLFLIVGHKGTGKSALLRILEAEERANNNIPISIRPDDIFEQTETDINRMIRIWQEKLSKIIFDKLIQNIFIINKNSKDRGFKDWLGSFSRLTFAVLGKKYADIHKLGIDLSYKDFLVLFKDGIFRERRVTVFIDDLDRGWKNGEHEIRNISAMLNALRTITREVPNIKFRVALRSSVYYAVRTSDESTDKIEGSVVWLKWTNHEILVMLVKRAVLFLKQEQVDESELISKSQRELSRFLKDIFESNFQGKGHWENAPMYRVLLSLIRQRPRDLIKLCSLAAHEAFAKKHTKILTGDLEKIFKNYSNGRLTDTINEYSSELNEITLKKILLEMKPSSKKEGNAFLYTPQELRVKMKHTIDHVGQARFSNGDLVDEKKLSVFLYKINFFTARKNSDKQIIRYYFDENNYILSEDIDFGFNFEIHPAYRWALQPKGLQEIYSDIDLVNE
ncbi:MAG TPA: ATP-binding protein [Candidatus Borkfalkia stercoripullorum]|nr:ATP-binding protein [Candidatus Borkfalkia stercoripullorum]